jgi:hypothetical protein
VYLTNTFGEILSPETSAADMKRMTIIGLIAVGLMVASGQTQPNGQPTNGHFENGGGTIVVQVSVPPSPWHKSALKEKLLTNLSRKSNGTAVRMEDAASVPTMFSLDSLIADAEASGARYVVTCVVGSEKLERRKTFSLPLIFHKYQTFGVIEGELRILDVKRRKLIVAEPFRSELNGPRIFQGSPEDDINDPDLHIDAAAKSKFFAQLEDQAVSQLSAIILRYARGK